MSQTVESPTAWDGRASGGNVQAVRLNGLPNNKPKPCLQVHRAQARLRELTGRNAFLEVWKRDLLERIAHAQWLQERGALFPVEQDDLGDAVRSWKLSALDVALDMRGSVWRWR